MKVQEIRNKFNSYFISKGHEKVSSSSLVPTNDNTLLFSNAGMNQFKDIFTGKEKASHKKVTTIQKVVRAGGKHNDLENVGLTARHHTFFEMLGNFSFGDYFKKEAISLAWEFLTSELKIPKEKLYVTVHHDDNETFQLWNQHIGLSKERIFKKGDKDNFWEMGEVGPCGPCSEIFYDHGKKYATPNFTAQKGQDILDDEMRYVEIWNLVFMQFEKNSKGEKKELPNKAIDTGMGLERIAAIMQNVYWNYDTDAFTPIIQEIENLTGKSYQNEKNKTPLRVVADHIRSSTMLITDGVIPSNEGRGYVLRRIIRRAIRFLKDLEAPKGSFSKLAPIVLKGLGREYPQNLANESLAIKLLQLEEEKFQETLDQGLKYLESALKKEVTNNIFNGLSAFKLYDTYGFPLDLTELILKEKNITIDKKTFNKAMNEQKVNSRKSWKGSFNLDDNIFHSAKEECGETKFLGYKETQSTGRLQKILHLNNEIGLIFNQTPFYAEGGGQMGDTGKIANCSVLNTQRPIDGLFVHILSSKDTQKFKIGNTYDLIIDKEKRNLTARNHSATHLLQAALTNILGDHIKQSGSMVNSERLRFDFTHMHPMTKEEIYNTEELVNAEIQKSISVKSTISSRDQAIKDGALALFGEKYGDKVRVIKMGNFSIELCGGTHVSNTNEIGLFTIISESSLSTGIRRIEATTSKNAINRLRQRSEQLRELELLASSKPENLKHKFKLLQADLKKSQKEVILLHDQITAIKAKEIFQNIELLKKKIPFKYVSAPKGSDLRKLSDLFFNKNPQGIVMLSSENKEKLSILLRSSKDLAIPCHKILKETLPLINGRGGGRPDMAQGSGRLKDPTPLVDKVRELILKELV